MYLCMSESMRLTMTQQVSDRLSGCRAEELVQRLLVAYDSPTGIPYNSIALDTLQVCCPEHLAVHSILQHSPQQHSM